MSENIKGEVVSIGNLKYPSILYKYRCFGNQHHEESLYEKKLYIPSANQFNDPYDSKIPFRYNEIELTDENIYKKGLQLAEIQFPHNPEMHQDFAYEVQRKGLLYDTNHLEKFDDRTYKELCSTYGILSLTPNPQDVLMWSYYANSHKGFCIGYDSDFLIKSGIFGMGGQVLYEDYFPKIPLFRTEDDKIMLKLLFTKWKKWSHEDEYRLIHSYKKGKEMELPPEAISEIILGCEIPDREKIILQQKIQVVLPNVKIFQIKLSKETFELKKETVVDNGFLLF